MSKKNKFYMLAGLPGSGKSSLAKKITEEADRHAETVLIGSDRIREELFGDASVQDDPDRVFGLMRARTLKALKSGRDVIYDACNVSSKRRRVFLQNLKKLDCEKVCIITGTPFDLCLARNAARHRVVPEEVIERMYTTWKTPAFFEGWDDIRIHYADGARNAFGDAHEFVMKYLDYDQMNPHHKETLGTHMLNTQANIIKNGYAPESDLALAALLHDCGKPFTKTMEQTDDGAVAHYYQHDCVGAYNALFFDYHGKTEKDILDVSLLINLHMYPFFWHGRGQARLRRLWGQELYDAVLLLHNADRKASVSAV